MAGLFEAFPEIARMAHWVSGSIASPSDLPPAELHAATAAFILNVAGLVLIRVLTGPKPVEKPEAAEYDEAA
jgi:hypothetical protein